MLGITKLGTGTAHNYFAQEFAAASNSYLSEDGKSVGIWQGKLAAELGLTGPVDEAMYHRAVDGQHPLTGDQLVRHRDTYLTREGKEATHIPAWDFTLSCPKTWSLAAIVGHDDRLMRAAEQANRKALEIAENYVQARGGGENPPITARNWLVATFRHDTARPVDGYPSPQLHFHNVVMNLVLERTSRAEGKWRSLQTAELYRISGLITQVFRDELLRQGRSLGYEMTTDPVTHAPEIKGFSQEYLDAESLRSSRIQAELEHRGFSGPRAAQIIALEQREQKLNLTPGELKALHQAHAAAFGNEADKAVQRALERGEVRPHRIATAEDAVTYGRRTLAERTAIFEHHQVVRNALRYGNGTVPTQEIEREIERRVEAGDIRVAPHGRRNTPAPTYRTPESIESENFIMNRINKGRNSVEPVASAVDLSRYKELADNPVRQRILRDILASRDQFLGLNGTAGSAKSTASNILRAEAEVRGFRVLGLAPTGAARDALREKGIEAKTLQSYLERVEPDHQKTLFILDETSLVSTAQLSRFLKTVGGKDRVLFVGDDAPDPKKVGQYTSVEAGRVFQLVQEMGMKTAQFNRIYRQKDEKLKAAVREFRHGNLERGFGLLEEQNRVHECPRMPDRYKRIAETFCQQPAGTTVVVPDNKALRELGAVIRAEMRTTGHLHDEDRGVNVLAPRDTTAAERTLAISYKPGDRVHFRKANRKLGIERGSYATVLSADAERNEITIRSDNGRTISYDPRQAAPASVYETRLIPIAAGDRIQFTAKADHLGVSTRDSGTVESIDAAGNMVAMLDKSGRQVRFNVRANPHFDYSYCMTGHSIQGKTVSRTIWNVEASDPRLSKLLSATAAYVGVSRPEHDLQVFVDSKEQLIPALSRRNEAAKALAPEEIQYYRKEFDLSIGG